MDKVGALGTEGVGDLLNLVGRLRREERWRLRHTGLSRKTRRLLLAFLRNGCDISISLSPDGVAGFQVPQYAYFGTANTLLICAFFSIIELVISNEHIDGYVRATEKRYLAQD